MSNIQIKKGFIYYYGNPAGYVKEQIAVVDTMFQREDLKEWLTEKNLSVTWTDGVFERLSRGEKLAKLNGEIKPLKKVRIWQLKADSDFALRFIPLEESQKRFGEPRIENYETVYDGELATNDLEEIYTKFNIDHHYGYEGHSLSMSDVVELYDDEGSAFHYVDRIGFNEISFKQHKRDKQIKM